MGHHHSPYNQVASIARTCPYLQFHDTVFAAVQVPADPGRYSRLGCLALQRQGGQPKGYLPLSRQILK